MLLVTSYDILSVINSIGPFIIGLFPVYVLVMFLLLTRKSDKDVMTHKMETDSKDHMKKAA
ncbi:MAG: hypothetical protein OEZ36_03055 [Spirochaetota bacterium]|nr:hypothetical protein [Spirochaetota bacterium]